MLKIWLDKALKAAKAREAYEEQKNRSPVQVPATSPERIRKRNDRICGGCRRMRSREACTHYDEKTSPAGVSQLRSSAKETDRQIKAVDDRKRRSRRERDIGKHSSNKTTVAGPKISIRQKCFAVDANFTHLPFAIHSALMQTELDNATRSSIAPTSVVKDDIERPRSKTQFVRLARRSFRSGAYKRKIYPTTYVPENPIVYEGSTKARDTTDQSLVVRAQAAGFDPVGFEADMGLHRSLFYYSPYLSCLNCNTICFIDVTNLRTVIGTQPALVAELHLTREMLPTCTGCGRTDTFLVGADDVAIQRNKADLMRRLRRERAAVRVIQEAYRRSLYYRHGRAQRQAYYMYTLLQTRMASIIQSMARQRLAGRRLKVEKDLLDIKDAHPIVMKWSLTTANNLPNAYKCFWYQQKGLVRQLYDNYWVLLERTGFRPKRHTVEENIRELAKRVRERTGAQATVIQKIWRGVLTRRYIIVFAREAAWLREQEVTAVFKIQRCFRGWLARRHAWSIRGQRWRKKWDGVIALKVEKKRGKAKLHANGASLIQAYVQEREWENTVRKLGRTFPKKYGGRRMRAYTESMYAGPEVTDRMKACLDVVYAIEEREAQREQKKVERIEWVKKQQGDNPYMQMYYADEVQASKQGCLENLVKKKKRATIRERRLQVMQNNQQQQQQQDVKQGGNSDSHSKDEIQEQPQQQQGGPEVLELEENGKQSSNVSRKTHSAEGILVKPATIESNPGGVAVAKKTPARKYIGEFLATGGVYRCYPRHVNDDPRAILRLEVHDLYNDELFALAAGRRNRKLQQQQQFVLPNSP